MAQYDGEIRINTKIDSGNYLKGLRKMSSQSKRLNNSISETSSEIENLKKEIKDLQNAPVGDNPAIGNIRNTIGETTDHIENLKKEISNLNDTSLSSDAILKYEDAWNTADQKYMELTKKKEQLEKDLSMPYPDMQLDDKYLPQLYQNNKEWKALVADIEKAENAVNKYDIKLEQAKASERSRRDNSIAQKTIALQKATNKLDVYNAKLKQMQEIERTKRDNAIEKKTSAMQKAINKLDVYKTKLSEINGSESGIAKKLTHISDVAKSGFGNLTKNTSKSKSMLDKLSTSASRFGKRVWRLLSSALVFSVLTKGFTALREKIAAAVKQNAQFSASMSRISGNMNSIFNNLLSAAMSALNTIISAIAKATSYLSAFVALLTGKTIKSSNAAADAANNQAGAVNGVGEAAKKASEYLNGYDEMNVQASKDNSGGSGGGGGTGSDITYEDADVSENVVNFLNRIKEAWKDADFTDLGSIVGNKINDGLENIDWTKIKETSYKIGKSSATFLNGVFETPDLFTNVGKTVAESLNTAINLAFGFADNFHWDSAGQAVADGINGFFNTFGFTDTAKTIKAWIKGGLDFSATLLEKTDFDNIGHKIGEFLAGLDLADYTDDIAGVIWRAIKGGFNLLKGVIEEAPLESALIAAFAILKFTGLGSAIARKISTSISTYLSTNGLSLALKGVGLTVALDGIVIALTGETNLKNSIESTIKAGLGTLVVTQSAQVALAASVAVASWNLGKHFYENVPIIQEWADLIAESIVGVWDGTLSLKDVLNKTFDFQLDLTAEIANMLFPDGEKFTKENVLDRIYKKVFGQDKTFDSSKTIAYNVAVGIGTSATEFAGKVTEFIKKCGTKIYNIAIEIGTSLTDLKKKVQDKINGIGQKAVNLKAEISTRANDLWSRFKNSWGNNRSLSSKLGISTSVSSLWKTVRNGWNRIKTKLTFPIKVPHFSWGSKTAKILGKLVRIPDLRVSWYANGGFPDMGQLFIARERGAEMVGNIGGKTAVANNDQITEAIASAVGPAVYDAVTAAMEHSGSGTGDITVYVGGQKITDYVIKDVRNRTIASGGKNPLLV